jgi:hypothetical protein
LQNPSARNTPPTACFSSGSIIRAFARAKHFVMPPPSFPSCPNPPGLLEIPNELQLMIYDYVCGSRAGPVTDKAKPRTNNAKKQDSVKAEPRTNQDLVESHIGATSLRNSCSHFYYLFPPPPKELKRDSNGAIKEDPKDPPKYPRIDVVPFLQFPSAPFERSLGKSFDSPLVPIGYVSGALFSMIGGPIIACKTKTPYNNCGIVTYSTIIGTVFSLGALPGGVPVAVAAGLLPWACVKGINASYMLAGAGFNVPIAVAQRVYNTMADCANEIEYHKQAYQKERVLQQRANRGVV